MQLSNEQQSLIEKRAIADSPSFVLVYLIWFFSGLFGGHRFYLHHRTGGIIMLSMTVISFILIACGIAFGGTPLDHLFYEPTVDDFLRYSQSFTGVILFYAGIVIFSLLMLWWLADIIFIKLYIQNSRLEMQKELTTFYQNYQNL